MTPLQQQLSGTDYDGVDVTIPNGASLSDIAEISAGEIVGIELPTITAALLSFQVSTDGNTFRNLFNSDGTTETQVASTAGDRVVQAPAALKECGAPYVKVRSGLAGAPTNQGANRVVRLIVQRIVGE